MPNPGSPQAMQQARQNMPPMPMPKNSMIMMLIAFAVMMVIMGFYNLIGSALNAVLYPVLGFGSKYPVVTIIIAGLIVITLSTVVRTFMTDFVAQARNNQIQKEFRAEMKKAKLENNLYKLKRLQEEQSKITAKSMETQTQMMKIMPITMVIVMPVYAWLRYFVYNDVSNIIIHLPFHDYYLYDGLWVIQLFVILYMMISMPTGYLESRVVRYYMLKKRLKELDSGVKS